MVFEFLSQGNMNDLLEAEKRLEIKHLISMYVILRIFSELTFDRAIDIASGLKYLESNKVVHRDLGKYVPLYQF